MVGGLVLCFERSHELFPFFWSFGFCVVELSPDELAIDSFVRWDALVFAMPAFIVGDRCSQALLFVKRYAHVWDVVQFCNENMAPPEMRYFG